MSDQMELEFYVTSDTGLIRRQNEDSAYVSSRLFIIADGMGGAAAGDLASTIVVQQCERTDQDNGKLVGQQMTEALADSADRANHEIAQLIRADPELDGMGSTMCGFMFDGQQLALAHIGDSRAYRFRDGVLTKVTHDHSWVQTLVDDGKLTEEEASSHPYRSLVVKVVNGQPENEPDLDLLDARLGDIMLVCSDGLSDMTTEAKISAVLADNPDLQVAGEKLLQLALAGGGTDNITFILARVVEHAPAQQPEVLGAARDFEQTTAKTSAAAAQSPKGSANSAAAIDPEEARYAPTVAPRRRWVRPLIVVLAVLVLLAIGIGAAAAWASSQYYVGQKDGQVAIYQGLVDAPGGIELSQLHSVDSTKISDLPPYYQERVRNKIQQSSLTDAEQVVGQLRTISDRCRQERSLPPTGTPTPPDPTPSDPGIGNPPVSSPPTETPFSIPVNTPSPTASETPIEAGC